MADEQGEPIDADATPETGIDVVNYDLLCMHCEYNLRTLALSGRCPECGSPVADSWTPAPPLHFADKEWLARLRRGTSLILWTILMGVIMGLVAMIVSIVLFAGSTVGTPGRTVGTPGGFPEMPTWYTVTLMAFSLAFFIFSVYAIFKATSPEPAAKREESDPRVRRYCRRVLIAWVVVSVVSWPLWWLSGWGLNPPAFANQGNVMIASMVIGMVGSVIMLAVWVCLMLFWRTLAVRAADRSIARQTKAVVWCVTVVASLFVVLQGASLAINPFWNKAFTAAAPAAGTPTTAPLTALGYAPATSLPATTAAATTMPASMPFGPAMGPRFVAFMAVSCFTALIQLALLGSGIWWVVLIFRYRSMLQRVLDSTVDPPALPATAP